VDGTQGDGDRFPKKSCSNFAKSGDAVMVGILGAVIGFIVGNLTSGHFYVGVAVGALVGIPTFRALASWLEGRAVAAGLKL